MTRRSGAHPSVLRGMGLTDGGGVVQRAAYASEHAPCALCRAPLQIETDALTRLIERCPTPECPNHRWRLATPTAELLAEKPKRERTPRHATGQPTRRRAS
ncbi:MAG: hypothetical protein JWM41_2873 [Gemmatimonadetes bacterium]|nr:hypothetical protein [Gemmatimonadota bacterium]